MHAGNLRNCNGRYSKLFPDQKISYWADSIQTARAEIKKHGASNNIIIFWSYDDATSTFPTFENQEPLKIIDGRPLGIEELIDKVEMDIPLTLKEEKCIQDIMNLQPDCLAFSFHAHKDGENYLFLEQGFRKLAIREIRLRLGNLSAENRNRIVCAVTSDYSPIIENYGNYFAPLARVKHNEQYTNSDEYILRSHVLKQSYQRIREHYSNDKT